MALGRRESERQQDLFITHDRLPKAPGHVFYVKLNKLLAEAEFDRSVEALCEPYYADGRGRPSLPPGVYFRMLFVGYFEGISSQRGIAWRCSDSLSLREFLGIPLGKDSPEHSSLSYIRDRLPAEVHEQVFVKMLAVAVDKKLLRGKTVAVDATTLEANAAMKSIVRRDSGEDYDEFLTRLMREQGLVGEDETPDAEARRRFDKSRQNKRVSNEEWVSETDADSRIAKMKDGRTHLAYKAEHVVDLDTEIILAAEVYHADQADSATLEDSVQQAQANQADAGSDERIEDVAADKGYHSAETVTTMAEETPYRTYIPEPQRPHRRKWKGKPPKQKRAVNANRRRTRGKRGKALQRKRSEMAERTFAHVCETGGARRTWLRGIEKVRKRYLIAAAAHNLSVVMRALFNMGTPRGLQKFQMDMEGLLADVFSRLDLAWLAIQRLTAAAVDPPTAIRRQLANHHKKIPAAAQPTAAA
jgi:transposase